MELYQQCFEGIGLINSLDQSEQKFTERSSLRGGLLTGSGPVTKQQSLKPRPQIPEHQCQAHEEQPHEGILRTGPDPRLTELSITRLDPEPAAIRLTSASRRLPRSRGGEHQFLVLTPARPVVPITLVADTDVDADGLVVGHQCVLMPAGLFSQEDPPSGGGFSWGGLAAPEHHRHQKGHVAAAEIREDIAAKKAAIQQQSADRSARFLDAVEEAFQDRDHGIAALDPSVREGEAMAVFNNASCGIDEELGRPIARLVAAEMVSGGGAVIGDFVEVAGNGASASAGASADGVAEGVIHFRFEDRPPFGEPGAEGIAGRLVGHGPQSQADGEEGDGLGGGGQNDFQECGRSRSCAAAENGFEEMLGVILNSVAG